MASASTLLTTPFHSYHLTNKAKMVDFTGWAMPLHYGSIIEEHKQVRCSGGLFDVSHMGRIRFSGKEACKLLDWLCTRQIDGMSNGQVRYSLICNENGGCHDDVLISRMNETEFLMVCNGANRQKINDHIAKHKTNYICKIQDETESTAMVAIQGPKVIELLSNLSNEVSKIKRYRFAIKNLFIEKIIISRTGYTGEDGVEVVLPKKFAKQAIDLMLKNVGKEGLIKPAGLGARDSLRLEAGMPLYGHELTENIDPISAGLQFAIKLDKGENDDEAFIGQKALQKLHECGTKRRLIGLTLEGRRSPRQYMPVLTNNETIGEITSGCFSPTLNKPIAMAYISSDFDGDAVEIDFGKAQLPARVASLPFYKI